MNTAAADPIVPDLDALRTAWAALREEQPKLRIRNAAAELGTSECALVATRQPDGAVALDIAPEAFVHAMPALGEVLCITRNDAVVHEKHGTYAGIEINGQMGVVLDPEIDLRVFLSQWKSFWAVSEPFRDDVRRSLQVFDAHGRSVHKVYQTKATDAAAWDSFVAAHQRNEVVVPSYLPARTASSATATTEGVDVSTFQSEWLALQDTHHFYGLLRRHNVSRTVAMRIAPPDHAIQVSNTAHRTLLQQAAAAGTPIMAFVGNPGCIQIHTGPVNKLVEMGPWYNVLDPRFNLHLDETAVHETWVVRKPTADGVVTSVELFDAAGEQILQFFGERKPGKPELGSWREIVDAVLAGPAA